MNDQPLSFDNLPPGVMLAVAVGIGLLYAALYAALCAFLSWGTRRVKERQIRRIREWVDELETAEPEGE